MRRLSASQHCVELVSNDNKIRLDRDRDVLPSVHVHVQCARGVTSRRVVRVRVGLKSCDCKVVLDKLYNKYRNLGWYIDFTKRLP